MTYHGKGRAPGRASPGPRAQPERSYSGTAGSKLSAVSWGLQQLREIASSVPGGEGPGAPARMAAQRIHVATHAGTHRPPYGALGVAGWAAGSGSFRRY